MTLGIFQSEQIIIKQNTGKLRKKHGGSSSWSYQRAMQVGHLLDQRRRTCFWMEEILQQLKTVDYPRISSKMVQAFALGAAEALFGPGPQGACQSFKSTGRSGGDLIDLWNLGYPICKQTHMQNQSIIYNIYIYSIFKICTHKCKIHTSAYIYIYIYIHMYMHLVHLVI